jgi:hypothetical protein
MDAKVAAKSRLSGARGQLVALSHRIHQAPELGFEEEKACAWLCDELDAAGFAVTRGVRDLPTALGRSFAAEATPAVNHQPEFAAHCASSAADAALMDGALAMARTAIDLAPKKSTRA